MNAAPQAAATWREVRIPAGGAWLYGDLALPRDFAGVVLFAHGSGSGRHSARNRLVAQQLHHAGIGTLLFDLLTVQEEQVDLRTREHRFDIPLLTRRMLEVTDWANAEDELRKAPVGYFGASTGSAAALIAAAKLGDRVAAVVSRGGRVDLAGSAALAALAAPTLLIAGGEDPTVLELNRQALERMRCAKELIVVPGATHLFEEQGALESVGEAAGGWFGRHMAIAQAH